jgi:hypothetical protein
MTTNYGDNPFAPGMTSDAYIPDQLIAGDAKIVTETATIGGGADLIRGSVLGSYVSAATAVAAAGANTGNGVMGAVTAAGQILEDDYVLRVTKAAANAGDFEVTDPQGDLCGVGSVGAAFVGGGLSFTLADGAADFVVGDTFRITTSALTTKYKLSARAAADGSQVPVAILADAAAASGGDVTAGIYLSGEFNQRAVTLGAGMTAAAAKDHLRRSNIYLKSSQSAADPT